MWRHHARRVGRHGWRALLAILLFLVLLSLPVLALLGSETGSRWLIERGLGMQKMLTLQVEGGTLLGGLELRDVMLHGSKFDLHVRHLLARWSLVHLLRGELALQALQGDDVSLRLTAPPSSEPTRLPTLILPIRLRLESVQLNRIALWRWQAPAALTLDRLALAGSWEGMQVQLDRLEADQGVIGRLALRGGVGLSGDYPLDATGRLQLNVFHEKGWEPLAMVLRGSVADLSLGLVSQGPLTAKAGARVRPFQQGVPYSASLVWQAVRLPWWQDQLLGSEGGSLRVVGTTTGLRVLGDARLAGRDLPAGRYTWRIQTDWSSANIESFDFNGLGGNIKADGKVSWQKGLSWKLAARLRQVDLARKWTVPRYVAPVLSGHLETNGRTSESGSALSAVLALEGGEYWQLDEQGRSWFWNIGQPQRVGLKWAGVSRLVPGLDALTSDSGQLDLQGSQRDYALSLAAGLAGARLPSGRWVAEVNGHDRHVGIQRIDYEGEAGHAGLGGELEIGTPLRWEGALSVDNFSTAWLSPQWSGQFSGYLAGHGSWGGAVSDIRVDDTHLAGTLQARPFAADGGIMVALPVSGWPRAAARNLRVAWGDNRATLDGGLEKDWNLKADLQLGRLEELGLPLPLQGAVQGHVALSGEERHPDVDLGLQGSGLANDSLRVATAQLNMQLSRLGEQASQVKLSATGVATASGRELGAIAVGLSGTQKAHVVDWRVQGASVQGDGSISGGFDSSSLDWSGQVDTGHVAVAGMDWQLAAPFPAAWSTAGRELHLAPHCWLSGEARLCNEQELLLGPRGSVHLALSGLQAGRLTDLLPEGLALEGVLEGKASGGWEAGQAPQLEAGLQVAEGKVILARDEDGAAPLIYDYQHADLTVAAGRDEVRVQVGLASQQMGQASLDARIDPYAETKPVQGHIALQGLRLEILQPFFPGMATLSGAVSAAGDITGDLHRPEFAGSVELAGGEVGMRNLPVNLHNIAARVDVKGTQADISGSTRSGQGQAAITGHADWSDAFHLDMDLTGTRFELRQEPMLLAEIDPALHLRVVPGQVDLTGNVRVPTARLNLQPLSDQAVPLSPDVHVLTGKEGEARVQVAGAMQGWLVNADVEVLLGDDVYFHGYGVNGRLSGGLRLRQQGRRGLEATGEVELDKDSRYDAYGQRLQIRRGRLIFAGNLTQPGLDVEAVREIDSKVVGVRVEGRANAPQATLFSDTAMSQEEIISYLVLGRPLTTTGKPDTGSNNSNLALAAAAIKLGAGGTRGLTSDVGSTLGITDFAVDAEGSGDDTQFTVSGYVSPKLYLRYGVGVFTPVNTATIRYKISSSLYLEAVSSLENAIDLFYNFRF